MELQNSIFDNKIFTGSFPANLQGVIDASLETLYGQSIWRQYLKWGIERTSLNFDVLIGRSRMASAASIIDIGNPDGAATGILQLPYDPSQVNTVAKVWSDPTADPIADIDKVVNAAAGKGQAFSEIWIDRSKWLQIKNYTAIKNALLGYLNAGSNAKFVVTLDNVNEVLLANGLPPFKVFNMVKNIEKDGIQQPINPFDVNNVVFVQDNQLGTVENAWTIESREPVQGVTYAKYDRTLLKKYRSHTPWAEWTEVLLNAIPAVDVAKLALLQTDVAA
jgi:hypothetical protein